MAPVVLSPVQGGSAPGDFLASEPKKTETEWRIALEPKQIEKARGKHLKLFVHNICVFA